VGVIRCGPTFKTRGEYATSEYKSASVEPLRVRRVLRVWHTITQGR